MTVGQHPNPPAVCYVLFRFLNSILVAITVGTYFRKQECICQRIWPELAALVVALSEKVEREWRG